MSDQDKEDQGEAVDAPVDEDDDDLDAALFGDDEDSAEVGPEGVKVA